MSPVRLRRAPILLATAAVLTLSTRSGGLRAELLTLPDSLEARPLEELRRHLTDLHEKALRSRKPWKEEDLRKLVSGKYLSLERQISRVRSRELRARALAQLALLYAEIGWVEKITPLEEALRELDPDLAARLGHFDASDHFVVRTVGAEPRWGAAALELGEAAHAGYAKTFGLETLSKVAGKKIRILIHVDPSNEQTRLYFHPSPPYHSELRFEMPEAKYLTLEGRRRIVYGFCHELGHMAAMWGKYGVVEEDHHAWAHYTGCLVVEEVYERLGNEPWPTWTAFQRRSSGRARLLEEVEGKECGLGSREAVLALFHRIGESFDPRIYGKVWAWLEARGRFHSVNRVRYLRMKDFREGLLASLPAEDRARAERIFTEG